MTVKQAQNQEPKRRNTRLAEIRHSSAGTIVGTRRHRDDVEDRPQQRAIRESEGFVINDRVRDRLSTVETLVLALAIFHEVPDAAHPGQINRIRRPKVTVAGTRIGIAISSHHLDLMAEIYLVQEPVGSIPECHSGIPQGA